jgi:chromosomal replication initiation ATPase DnaA
MNPEQSQVAEFISFYTTESVVTNNWDELKAAILADALQMKFSGKKRPMQGDVVWEICRNYFGIDEGNHKCRKRELVTARQTFWYVMKKHTSCSFASIGARFGKDHATVMHGIRSINELMETDKELFKSVNEIENKSLCLI